MQASPLSDQVLEASASFLFNCQIPTGSIELHWHAGEPLAAGLPFYRRAFALFAERTPAGVRLRHTLQTNGTLINQEWCELFSQYQVEIGLSIDGPAEIHDLSRHTWSGRGTHAKVMQGYHLLRRSGLSLGAICVLRRESLRRPDAIYDFFKQAGFDSIAFNVEESEGAYLHSGLRDLAEGDIRNLYASFMRRIWKRWRQDKSSMAIREFKQMLGCLHRLREDSTFVRELDEIIPFRIITIRRDGGVSTFSPELASTQSSEYGNFVLGNVFTDTLAQVAASTAFARLGHDVAIGEQRCRETCEHYALCGAGFQSNRLTEHGTFHATETLTCRLQRKTLADVLVEELIAESKSRRTALPPVCDCPI